MTSDIKYAKSGKLNIAYQVVGVTGDPVILIPGWVSNLEEGWSLPGMETFIHGLTMHHRLVLFDKRGTGLSDRVNEDELPDLEDRIEDLNAIIEKENLKSVSIIGVSEGGPMAILYSARFPERVRSLVLIGSYACWTKSKTNPFGIPIEKHELALSRIDEHWGKGYGLKNFAPSWVDHPAFSRIWASFLRKSASPNTAKALYRMNLSIDVQTILPDVNVPTLVIHRKHDRLIPFELGKQLAESIPGATFFPLEGEDHVFWIDADGTVIKRINTFLGHQVKTAAPPGTIYTLVMMPGKDAVKLYGNPGYPEVLFEKMYTLDSGTVLVFRSTSHAVDFVQQWMDENKQRADCFIHTGVAVLGERSVSGPALALLQNAIMKIPEKGVWVSASCYQFLKVEKVASAKMLYVPDPISLQPLVWHQLVSNAARQHIVQYAMHVDDKLNLADIALILKVKDYLDVNYQTNPALKELTLRFGLNSFKLKYGFRKLFKVPVKQYVINLRLVLARQLLQETNLSVSKIASMVGYQQPASFSKAYLSKFGLSPNAEKRG